MVMLNGLVMLKAELYFKMRGKHKLIGGGGLIKLKKGQANRFDIIAQNKLNGAFENRALFLMP